MPTATQIAQGRMIYLSAGLLMALSTDAPLLASLSARSSPSTKFMSARVVGLPDASPFINYGEGFVSSEGQIKIEEFDCSLVGGQIKSHRLTARKWDKEHGALGVTWHDLQTELKFKAQGLMLEKQIVIGKANDAKGFPGFKDITPFAGVLSLSDTPAKYGFARSVINAGGSTANTAQSVYAIIEGEMDTQLILGDDVGGNAEIFQLSEMVTTNEAPDSNDATKKALHDVQEFSGHIGLSISGFNQTPGGVIPVQYSLRRLANVTADSGHTLTDAMMSKLSRSFGVGKMPTKFVTGTRSGEQLGASRQATAINFVMGQTGDAAKATYNTYPEPPDNWRGIPIIYADNTVREDDAIEA
jgi:hypothetical protein